MNDKIDYLKEIEIKHSRIKVLLASKNFEGLILAKNSSFKWFTCGHMNDVIKNDDTSLVFLFITQHKRFLLATKSDAARVMAEELEGLGFELVLFNWYNENFLDAVKRITDSKNIGADFISDQVAFLGTEISDIRTVITEYEINRFRELCSEYKTLLTDYCTGLRHGITEKQISTGLECECAKKGIRLPVLMVGSDERIFLYRHPCATDKKVDKYILIATVVEREGLCANLTRSVYFGSVPEELKAKQDAVNFIESNYQYYSRPGSTLGQLLEEGKKAYKKVGYNGEWENHPQGGIAGYTPLEIVATLNNPSVIKENNIVSWNPTIKGVKSEDPILITKDIPVQFTIDTRWPSAEYEINGQKFKRPLILEL